MANEEYNEFISRRDELLARLMKGAGVGDGPMNLEDLRLLAATLTEFLMRTIANMPEPMRGEILRGLPERFAADVAQKRARLEQQVPIRNLDSPEGSA